MNIQEGDVFPAVSGQTYDGQSIHLEDFRGNKNVVLYFYPKDLTPGCTREAIDFDRKLEEFAAHNTAVVGMSVDPIDSHQRFSQACGLHFPLLSDEDAAISRELGIISGNYAQRTTFVIDTAGRVRRIFSVSQVDGHVDAVLEAVATLD